MGEVLVHAFALAIPSNFSFPTSRFSASKWKTGSGCYYLLVPPHPDSFSVPNWEKVMVPFDETTNWQRWGFWMSGFRVPRGGRTLSPSGVVALDQIMKSPKSHMVSVPIVPLQSK